jgi:hypothetical protein
VLLEQFDTMKRSFENTIKTLTEEISLLKFESNRKLRDIKEELENTTKLKDLFLLQVIDLQKRIPQI